MQKLHQHVSPRHTPQSQAIPGEHQVRNRAGGYVYEIDHWAQMRRFLILGTEGGYYYAGEKELTVEMAEATRRCIKEDGARAVDLIVEISDAGRAPKNDPALFALAMACASDSRVTRVYALRNMHKVVRIGTHLFTFVTYLEAFRGWGRTARYAVQRWYQCRTAEQLAVQMVKYKQRGGWSHRDVLRMAHPVPEDEGHRALYAYACGKIRVRKGGLIEEDEPVHGLYEHLPSLVRAHEDVLHMGDDPKGVATLIRRHYLTHEMVPNELKDNATVWAALLERMPITALIRNLGKMTAVGLLRPGAEAVQTATTTITNKGLLERGRVHPITILAALMVYKQGHGVKGGLEWTPVAQIVDALDEAFYTSFNHLQPTGKRLLLALDVSSSMTHSPVAGMDFMTAHMVTAAMALVTASVEQDYAIVGFGRQLVPLSISPRQRLDDVLREVQRMDFGNTDCALPVLWAEEGQWEYDAFVVYTDNETWAGHIHPSQALRQYRQRFVPDAKLVVLGTAATKFSIADPADPGMLDVVGFDASVPAILSDFIRGGL